MPKKEINISLGNHFLAAVVLAASPEFKADVEKTMPEKNNTSKTEADRLTDRYSSLIKTAYGIILDAKIECDKEAAKKEKGA